MLRTQIILILFVFAPIWGGRADHSHLQMDTFLRGVDVSHHQKHIDWETVVSDGLVDFAFVKATEGGDFIDTLFCRNWDALLRVGVRRGAYHFFRAYGCGEDQAKHFLQLVEMQPGDLAPVLDIELTDNIAPEIMVAEALIWLQVVESQLGIRPIIYTNQHFYERYLAGHFDAYPLWIARYSEERPDLTCGRDWNIWQFSNEGSIEGIPKKVDLNLFPGNKVMLDQLCWYPKQESSVEEPAARP